MKLNKRLVTSLLTACMLASSFAPAALATDENGADFNRTSASETALNPIGGGY